MGAPILPSVINSSFARPKRYFGSVRHVFESQDHAVSNERIDGWLAPCILIQKWQRDKSHQKERTKSSHVGTCLNAYSKITLVVLLFI